MGIGDFRKLIKRYFCARPEAGRSAGGYDALNVCFGHLMTLFTSKIPTDNHHSAQHKGAANVSFSSTTPANTPK